MYSPIFIVKSAQNMRSRMTTAEGKLWERLSNGLDGARFRRHYPIGNHVVNFYCRKLKLIVEISRGGCHVQKERDAYLRACGYNVLRISEKEVKEDFPRIIRGIGFRVRTLRMYERLASVKAMFRHILNAAFSLSGPKRRVYVESSHRLGLLSA